MKQLIIASIMAVVGVLFFLVEFKSFDKVDFKAESSQSQQTKLKVQANYGQIPMHFEPNQGQAAEEVEFVARGCGYTLHLTKSEAALSLKNEGQATELKMKLANANANPEVEGRDRLPGKSHYYIGNDSEKWHTDIPHYGKVRYGEVYPGIDMVYYGNPRQLQFDLVVAPGANPEAIELAFAGQDNLQIEEQGEALLSLNENLVTLKAPVIYQEVAGGRQLVAGNFVQRDEASLGFAVGEYDPALPLVIDPELLYASYLGGPALEIGQDIAVDAGGDVYIAGIVRTTNNADDIFVTKLSADGATIIYSTQLGGTFGEGKGQIAVDQEGNAYVASQTFSNDFPTPNGFDDTLGGLNDVVIAKLDPAGVLVYGSYLGGSEAEAVGTEPLDIAVDKTGKVYVSGETRSFSSFPTRNAFQNAITTGGFGGRAFLSVFDPTLSGDASLLYSTFFGGNSQSVANDVAVDTASGVAYVSGSTCADISIRNAFQSTRDPAFCTAFIARFDPSLTGDASLLSSTYMGNGGAQDIALDGKSNLYAIVQDGSFDGAFSPTFSGSAEFGNDIVKFNPEVKQLLYYVDDILTIPIALAVDASGFASVVGANFGPAIVPFAKLNTGGSDTLFTFKFGVDIKGGANSIATDASGNIYVTGSTFSSEFPTVNAVQPDYGGGTDAFILKFGEAMDFELFFDGVAFDPGNFVPGAFPLQNQYTGLGVRGSGLGNVTEVIFSPDDQLLVSNVQASANEITFDLAVWDKVQLGERDLILKKSDGQQINVTDMIGRKFMITQAFFEFNQAVADRDLRTDAHRLVQIAGKPGVMRVQFEDDVQIGRTFAGTLFVTDLKLQSNAVAAHEIQNGYTVAEVRNGEDYLTIPYPSPDPNVARSLPEGEHEFTCLLSSDDLIILGPDLQRQFVESEELDIVIYDALIGNTSGFPPFQHRLTDADIDEAISFVKRVYPISDSRLRVTRDRLLVPANATIENASGERINVQVVGRSKDENGNFITHITSEKDEAKNGEAYLFATLKELLDNLNAEGNFHNVIVLLLPEDMLVKNLANGTVNPGIVGITSPSRQVILVSEEAANLGPTIAHEVGHLVVTALRQTSFLKPGGAGNLGDEYECGSLHCRVNFPVQEVQDVSFCNDDLVDLTCVLSPLMSGIHGDSTGTFASRSGFDAVRLLPRVTLLDVGTFWNFMSAGVPGVEPDPVWVSNLVYNELLRDFVPGAVSGNAQAQNTPFLVGEIIDITGTIRDDDTADFDNFSVSTVGHITPDSGGPYRLELQDSGGGVLASHDFEVQFVELAEPARITDRVSFGARMELVAGSRRVVLKKDGIELAARTLSDNLPTVQITSPQAGATLSGVVELNWIGSDTDGDRLSYSILLADGNGEITPIASLLPDSAFIFDTSLLPPGTSASIQVIATDGFNRGSDVVDNITLAASVTLSPPFNLAASASGDTVTLNWDAPTPMGANSDKQNALLAKNHLWSNQPPMHLGVKEPKRPLARSSSKSGTKRRTLIKSHASQVPEQLTNGVPVTRSVAEGGILEFFITVPADADSLVFLTSNSSGDPDLFVQFASAPDLGNGLFDFSSENFSPLEETIIVTLGTDPPLTAGDWFVTVEGFEASTFTLTATHHGGNASGLLSYNIYRSATSNARVTGTLLGNVNANTTSFTDIIPSNNSFYQVTAVYDQGESIPSNEASLLVTSVENTKGNIPDRFALSQNYPNPFNPETRIQYDLPKSAQVKIEIFNLLGQKIRTLLNEQKPAGTHAVVWDSRMDNGQQAASGVYIYRLQAERFMQSRKLLLLR